MDYELAKQLKESGYPQIPKGITAVYPNFEDPPYIPTLSELIEACDIGGHILLIKLSSSEMWEAQHTKGTRLNSGLGKTPEEAVARLWLELNKQ